MRPRIGKRQFSRRAGAPPGILLENRNKGTTKWTGVQYDSETLNVQSSNDLGEFPQTSETGGNLWIQVFGIDDSETLAQIGDRLGIHKLTLEDIQNTDRRFAMESHEGYFFQTFKRLVGFSDAGEPLIDTVSLILKPNLVVSFHDGNAEAYGSFLKRLENPSSRLRQSRADYLAYALADEALDSWMDYTEGIEDTLIDLEEKVLFRFEDSLIREIHGWKSRLAYLRWLFRPYRDLRQRWNRDGEPWFGEDTHPFLADLNSHAVRVIDLLDLYRDMAEGLLAIHMTELSNRMNRVMKVLTVISTIFIPMTFLAGIYGMNFSHMPELNWKWAYPVVLGLMASSALGMLVYFRRKRWL